MAMDLGLACHACGTLNPIGSHLCSHCGVALTPGVPVGEAGENSSQPTGGSSATIASPMSDSEPAGGPPPPPLIGPGSSRTVAAPSTHHTNMAVDETIPESSAAPTIASSATQPDSGGHSTTETAMPEADEQATTATNATVIGATAIGATVLGDAPPFDPNADPNQPVGGKTLFFGALQQQPVVPRLVVIKGEGGDGATYHLQGATTVIGRGQGDITFVEDPFLSPEHARFTSQHGRLFVQDAESENGVFLRIKKPTPLTDETYFLVGEQLLRLKVGPFSDGSPGPDGTYYYGSPRPDGAFQVIQCLAGGGEGRICTAEGNTLSLGREGNTLNFPDDRFISGHHARLDADSDSSDVMLTDTGSRNGTFIRLDGAQELFHGDYLFVGQQLLRVEIA